MLSHQNIHYTLSVLKECQYMYINMGLRICLLSSTAVEPFTFIYLQILQRIAFVPYILFGVNEQ